MSTDSKETRTEAVQERLIEDIVSGALEPGQNLRIEILKDQYRVGASPLREALSRLTSLGFVTNETRRGFRVAPMSEEDLADLTRLRQMVEGEALRESIAAHDPEWEMELAGSFAKRSLAATRQYGDQAVARRMIEVAHRQFHRALVGACRSPRIPALQELLYDLVPRSIAHAFIAPSGAGNRTDALMPCSRLRCSGFMVITAWTRASSMAMAPQPPRRKAATISASAATRSSRAAR